MPHPLLPSLNGANVTVDTVLNDTGFIAWAISEITGKQTLIDKFFRPVGTPIANGGLLYQVATSSDFYTAEDLEARAPGTEYRQVQPTRPEDRLATVEDFGGFFEIFDEERRRNRIRDVGSRIIQLGNTLTRKIDTAAMKAITAATDIAVYSPSENWEDLVFVGPEADLTPSAARPTAHFAEAQLLAALEEMGVVHDLAVMNPTQEAQLRIAYGSGMDSMLKSVGLELFSNPRIPEGVVYLLEKGGVGMVGFEEPLTVEVIDERKTRKQIIRAYAVPLFAVDRPYACKKVVLPA